VKRALLLLVPVLVACGSGMGTDRRSQLLSAADSADQIMDNLKTHLTNEGVQTAYLEADSAYVYENRGHTDLKKIRVTFYTPQGVRQSILIADGGWYRMRTGEMEARGNVVITRTDGARLSTSVLTYDQSKNQVSTTEPYTYDRGDQHGRGVGFTSDPAFSNIVTQRLRGAGGSFALPGQ